MEQYILIGKADDFDIKCSADSLDEINCMRFVSYEFVEIVKDLRVLLF